MVHFQGFIYEQHNQHICLQHESLQEPYRRQRQCCIPPRRSNPSSAHSYPHLLHEAHPSYPQRLVLVDNVYVDATNDVNVRNGTAPSPIYIPETVDRQHEEPAAILSRYPPIVNLDTLQVLTLVSSKHRKQFPKSIIFFYIASISAATTSANR